MCLCVCSVYDMLRYVYVWCVCTMYVWYVDVCMYSICVGCVYICVGMYVYVVYVHVLCLWALCVVCFICMCMSVGVWCKQRLLFCFPTTQT